MFVSRILGWLGEGGAQAVVVPQNWLFLTSYRKLRERLLWERTWRLVARLGPGAFETITGHVVNVALTVLSAEGPESVWRMAGIDVSVPRGETPIPALEKAKLLAASHCSRIPVESASKPRITLALQRSQLGNPSAIVVPAVSASGRRLSALANCDDGVRLNIRPFMRAELQSGSRKAPAPSASSGARTVARNRRSSARGRTSRGSAPAPDRVRRPSARTTPRHRKPRTMEAAGTSSAKRRRPPAWLRRSTTRISRRRRVVRRALSTL